MNNVPREKLCEIIARHGRSVIEDPRRVEGLLRDYCGEYRREVSVLVMTLEEGVAADMASSTATTPREVLLARMTRRLCDHLALSEPAATWAVDSWALALNVVSEDELGIIERQRNGQTATAATTNTIAPVPTVDIEAQPLSASPAQIIVSAKGDGAHASIGEALKAAATGARIIIRPGLYNEGLIINKRVELIGDGPVEDIVIRSDDSSCIQMRAERAAVKGLTLRGRARRGHSGDAGFFAVDIPQGELLLDNCDITSDTLSCVAVHGPTTYAVVSRCRIHDGADSGLYFFDGALGTVEDCEVFRNANVGVAVTEKARPTVRGCKIYDGKNAGLVVWDKAQAVVESCEIYGNSLTGVGVSEEGKLDMRGCSIHEGENSGIFVHQGGEAILESCDVFGHREAELAVTTRGNMVARECKVCQSQSFGVFVREGGQALLEGCAVMHNSGAGVSIGVGAVAALRRCRVKDNGQVAIRVMEGGALSVEDSDLADNLLGPWDVEEGAFVESARNRER
jgi:nitrous oxidase accessory protein NosD